MQNHHPNQLKNNIKKIIKTIYDLENITPKKPPNNTSNDYGNTNTEQYAIELNYIAVLFGSILSMFITINNLKYFIYLAIFYIILTLMFFIIIAVDNSGI